MIKLRYVSAPLVAAAAAASIGLGVVTAGSAAAAVDGFMYFQHCGKRDCKPAPSKSKPIVLSSSMTGSKKSQ